MKKIISSVMLFAAAAMAFSACQKQEIEGVEVEQVSGLTFSSVKPSFDDESKTEWTGTTIQWSAKDKIRVAYTCDDVWQNADGTSTAEEESGKKTAKMYESTQISEATEIAHFTVPGNFKSTNDGVYEFYGIYPSSAVSSADIKYAPSVTVDIPAGQTPLENSFDSKADLMASKSIEYSGIPKEGDSNGIISLKWERLVAHACITLKDLPIPEGENETVTTIKLVADEDADMVGTHYLYLDTYNVVRPDANAAGNSVTLDAANLKMESNAVTFWTSFLPCAWKSLEVQMFTDKASYTRSIDLSETPKTFLKNARNTLIINMGTAERKENKSTASATLTFDDKSKRTEFSTTKQVWMENGITLTNDKDKSTSNVADYAKPARFYAKSTITITAPGNLTMIEFDCNSNSYATDLGSSISGSVVSSDKVSVTLDGNSTSQTYTLTAQARVDAVTVTYITDGTSGESPVPVKLDTPSVSCNSDKTTENSLTFTWNSVANVSKYKVVLNGMTVEQTETSYTATDLTAGTEYEISVTALGDGTNYTDSDAGTCTATTTSAQGDGDEGGEAQLKTKNISFSSYTAGTQYANGEEHDLGDGFTLTINGAHLNTQVRLYAGSNATIQSSGTISNIDVTAGYKAGTLNVYGSTDGSAWTLVKTISTTTSYKEYNVVFPSAEYTWVKFESVGAQIRLSRCDITYEVN